MLNKLFRQTAVPKEYHANFIHLYFDIAWFGVLSGSTINFLNIYATRIGATGFQIGLIGAMAAVVNLTLAIPSGRWLARQHIGPAIFWTSVFYRVGFLVFVFLPWLFNESGQVIAIIALTFLMAIPLTPLGVGFTALFAEAVPNEYRAHVAGTRNVMLAVMFMFTSLLSGYLLDKIPFPSGYQIVFAIGFVGAAMSSFHLYYIRPLKPDKVTHPPKSSPALPGRRDAFGASVKTVQDEPALFDQTQGKAASTPQTDSLRNISTILRLDIWNTPYRSILLVLFGFHLAQYLALPIFPVFNVRELGLNDNQIGIGTALFYLTVLLGSTQLRRIVHRLGNKQVTGWGVVGMALYPTFIAFAKNASHFYLISIIGGFVWALVGGSYANYMLEHIPPDDRPPHLAWYNIVLNIAVLIGSLGGPAIADQIGLFRVLILFGVLRFLAGIAILKWG